MATPGGGVQLNRDHGLAPAREPPDSGREHIQRLAPGVANAIAAGEVIERPASVVKELIENSLDAGASRISVEIDGGGSRLIRVTDNGRGMPAGELALAFQRHATSKLREVGDLSRISTFGFRGEALASIAAVAVVTALSREATSLAGASLSVSTGEGGNVVPAAAPPGTTVEVRDLFRNTPARRAFLRSERTEARACLRVVSEAALGRPDVRLEAFLGARRVLVSPGGGDIVDAARAVLGRAVAEQLLPVAWAVGNIAVSGVLGAPGVAQASRNSLVLMVNGRRVHQRGLLAAVEGAYRGMIEVGRHPLAVIDVRCALSDVDVNVHPTKREVRFREDGRFFDAVQRACWGALRNARPAGIELAVEVGRLEVGADVQPPDGRVEGMSSGPAQIDLLGEQLGLNDDALRLADAVNWRYLGQAHNRYLVVETERGIALLDQHAAHEKILYARIVESLTDGPEAGTAPSQGLLTPTLLEVGPLMVAGLVDCGELLRRTGFDLEAFGEATIRCSAVPMGTRLSELPALLGEVLGTSGGDRERPATQTHKVAASVACHTAIRFGDPVTSEEVTRLLIDLANTPGGITCPHGRPSVLLLSERDLLGAFRRRP
ncbi:MAG TPA: DNA mismatch repair endonuclease MutL [Candidatus Dormibacteraeota bacterium]|nr:DNA mismatch repair endonuclease MutL [Candidatus Dormibacteraeota bacterium]